MHKVQSKWHPGLRENEMIAHLLTHTVFFSLVFIFNTIDLEFCDPYIRWSALAALLSTVTDLYIPVL